VKTVGAELSELLQVPIPANPGESSQAIFAAIFNEAGPEDHVIPLDLSPVPGCGFLIFPAPLLFRVLDILLAMPESTSGDTGSDDSRRVTGIELHILREFFDVFTRTLRETWDTAFPLAFHPIISEDESETQPEKHGDDLALILSTKIDIGVTSADVRLVLPAFLARLIQLKSAEALNHYASEPVSDSLLKCLGDATLQMDAVMEGGNIRIGSLLDLAPGQILVLGNGEDAFIDFLVNRRRQFAGALIASNGKCAVQIDSLVDQAERA
jgi:flagellar motor switch protein FliM